MVKSYLFQANKNTAHYTQIFNDAALGGCAGYCHNSTNAPYMDGTGHGVITNCLDCHGNAFYYSGRLHVDHKDMLERANLECYQSCHKAGNDYGAPIDGGCYDCHKSGHAPYLMETSACYAANCHPR